MENSTHSSMIRALSSKDPTPSSEESGWTMYFDDFMTAPNGELPSAHPSGEDNYRGTSSSSSSLVSDAASYTAWKLSSSTTKPSSAPTAGFKKLSFRKRKTGAVLEDDSLEDTASSPVNSPKVGDLKLLDINRSKKDGDMNSCQEKMEVNNIEDCSDPRTDERNEMSFDGNDCTELKKRGLCLVPLSMLVNYLE